MYLAATCTLHSNKVTADASAAAARPAPHQAISNLQAAQQEVPDNLIARPPQEVLSTNPVTALISLRSHLRCADWSSYWGLGRTSAPAVAGQGYSLLLGIFRTEAHLIEGLLKMITMSDSL